MSESVTPAMNRAIKEEEEELHLSPFTLAALNDFYQEKLFKQDHGGVEEDWHLSQFWYTSDTSLRLAREALSSAGPAGRIACISSPSVYFKLKDLQKFTRPDISLSLLEFDQRFLTTVGNDFVFYDYNKPLMLPAGLPCHSYDVVLADPPYLNEECLTQVAKTIQLLAKDKIILCTGSILKNKCKEILGLTPSTFVPLHTSKLGNAFSCFTNFTLTLDEEMPDL
uniref:EEF1A lysine methyltransferase 1-like isoform X1 n=1 Tax=Myxine glutinosa TaxID=7769 RepID=UPI00358FC356